MSFLALDVATATGWSQWTPGWEKPHFGTWKLPGGADAIGEKCVALHRKLADLHSFSPFDRIYMEAAIQPGGLQGFTNVQTIHLLVGLCSHVESFGAAYGLRVRQVPNSSWKKHFFDRGTRGKIDSKTFKNMSMVRCHELGWHPDTIDSADSLGILDYAIHLAGITTPWQDRAVFGPIDG